MIVMKITKVAFLHTKHRQQQHQQSLQQQQHVHCSNMLLKTNKVLIAPIASGCGSLVVVVDSNMDCHPTSAAATTAQAAKASSTTTSALASTSAASSSFACNKSHLVIVDAAAARHRHPHRQLRWQEYGHISDIPVIGRHFLPPFSSSSSSSSWVAGSRGVGRRGKGREGAAEDNQAQKRTSNCGTRMSQGNDCHEDNKSCLFAYQTSPATTSTVVATTTACALQQHVAQN